MKLRYSCTLLFSFFIAPQAIFPMTLDPRTVLPVVTFATLVSNQIYNYYTSWVPYDAHYLKHNQQAIKDALDASDATKQIDALKVAPHVKIYLKSLVKKDETAINAGLETLLNKHLTARSRLWFASALRTVGCLLSMSLINRFGPTDSSWLSGIYVAVGGFLGSYGIIEVANTGIDYVTGKLTGTWAWTFACSHDSIVKSATPEPLSN